METRNKVVIIVIIIIVIIAVSLYFIFRKTPPSSNGTTPPSPPNPPIPPPSNPLQTSTFRVTNGSDDLTMWIQSECTLNGVVGSPIPGYDSIIQLNPGEYQDYDFPKEGLIGSRFWAKIGCDVNGQNCEVGEQIPTQTANGPMCPPKGCTPAMDSLIEITSGCSLTIPQSQCVINTSSRQPLNNTTWFDTSQVDGWTLPYIVYIKNSQGQLVSNSSSSCNNGTGVTNNIIDGSKLDLTECPSNENLSLNGLYNTATDITLPKTYNLQSVDLRFLDSTGQNILGCMSPCQKLTYGQPYGFNQPEAPANMVGQNVNPFPPSVWMCCPTPGQYIDSNGNPTASCTVSNGCVSSQQCNSGPSGGGGIKSTQYYGNLELIAPGIYSFAYDDVSLNNCPVDDVVIEMVFYPKGSPQYPLPISQY
jgi:hypothetical protein